MAIPPSAAQAAASPAPPTSPAGLFPPTVALSVAVVSLSVLWSAARRRRRRPNDHRDDGGGGGGGGAPPRPHLPPPPPAAPGSVPLLGHALSYSRHPPSFLAASSRSLSSPVFSIDLAGRRMVVVGSDPLSQKCVASAPETVLSARRAVAEVGFEYTLGKRNVYEGTDWHKRILRDEVLGGGGKFEAWIGTAFEELERGLDREIAALGREGSADGGAEGTTTTVRIPDLFGLVRRSVLRSLLSLLVSPRLVSDGGGGGGGLELLDDLMGFQDMVEDATAKAAVLPRWLALPTALWPTERRRMELQRRLEGTMTPLLSAPLCDDKSQDDVGAGPWLRAFRSHSVPPSAAAELVVGLMFAAHKNPAIAAAQSWCYLTARGDEELKSAARREAREMAGALRRRRRKADGVECAARGDEADPTPSEMLLRAATLRSVALETLRLTSHSIGAIRTVVGPEPFRVRTLTGESYGVDAGEMIALSHIVPHLDERAWGEDAEEFRPGRWTEKDANGASTKMNGKRAERLPLASPVDEYTFTAFSNGLHKCPGERAALAAVQLTLALLLERDAELTEGKVMPDVDWTRATLAQRGGRVGVALKAGAGGA